MFEVYEFFKSQGTVIANDTVDFTGMNGCYLYQGQDVKVRKSMELKDQMLVLAPYESIVLADIWLTCYKKLMNNMKIQPAQKATHTCLAGKIITRELEVLVYQQMIKKLESYKTLTGKKKAAKTNPKITALQVELTHGDSEIEKLVESDGRYTSCQMTTLRSLL